MAILARASCTLSTVRDVASTTRYYKLQSSTASKPAKPTTNPPSGWTTTEPSYTEGSTNSLYFTDLTVFTDGDFAYSDVSLSSSYEAAKQAYNKAVSAGTAAEAAQKSVDGIEIGGRNYILNSTGNYGTNNWNGNAGALIITITDGINNQKAITVTPKNISGNRTFATQVITDRLVIAEDTTLTISYWYKAGVNAVKRGVGAMLRLANDASPYNDVFYPGDTQIVDGEWHYYSKTADVGKYANTGISSILFMLFCQGDSVSYSNIKLETGNKATDWTPAPEDLESSIAAAQTAANNAMTAANGKNKVFHQATAPATSAGLTAGDIWFDTSNDYKMSRWTGSAWTEEQFGESAIADASIGNAKIKDASIEHAKIKSLDMGKATVGKLKAQYLDVDDVFAQNLKLSGTLTVEGTDPLLNGKMTIDTSGTGSIVTYATDNSGDEYVLKIGSGKIAAYSSGDPSGDGSMEFKGSRFTLNGMLGEGTLVTPGEIIVSYVSEGGIDEDTGEEIPQENYDLILAPERIALNKDAKTVIQLQDGNVTATNLLKHHGGFTVPQIQKGTTALVTAPANGYIDIPVTFNKEFAGNPTILCGLQGNAANGKYGYLSCSPVRSTINTTGVTLRVYNADSGGHNTYVSWIAVY